MFKRGVLLIVVFLLIVSSVYATDYYADVVIDIDTTGSVSISGLTNHPILNSTTNSQEFTSKEGKYWIFNLTTNDIFSDFIYEIHLPKNSAINYIKLPELGRFEQSNNNFILIGTGKNKRFNIVIQYQFKKGNVKTPIIWIILIIIGILILSYYYFKLNKKNNYKDITKDLTERQLEIFNIIKKNKGKILQSKLQNEVNFPKSSLSRNIDSLVRKGILVKHKKGMSNYLEINNVPASSGEFRQK